MTTAPEIHLEEELPEDYFALSRDLARAAATLGDGEARFLVDIYYEMQRNRITAANQIRSLSKDEEPHAALEWVSARAKQLENQVRRALAVYADSHTESVWAQSIVGVGPVIAAGLKAHVDVERSTSVAHLWSFAGLNPTAAWKRGEKRPWNARLKVLAWKAGDSFVKTKGRDDAFYGPYYDKRKAYEQAKNDAGDYAPLAERALSERNIKDKALRETYEAGRLPDGRIHLRCLRWVSKLFLSHYWQVAYETRYNRPAPLPYAVEHLGHVDIIHPPNWISPPGERESRPVRRD